MSRSAVKSGAATVPTSTTTGTPGASDEVLEFLKTFARPCFVTNTDASDDLFILLNEEGASATDFMVKLAPLQAVDLSVEGQICVKTISLYYATAAYSKAKIRGWVV